VLYLNFQIKAMIILFPS